MKTIATVGGLGYSRVAPGTLGSIVGLGIAWILSVNPIYQWIGCGVAVLLGFWSAGPTARALGTKDPHPVIIDEVAGMMIAVAALPVTGVIYAAAFLLFRLLDVIKPFPIRQSEKLPGSLGIMLDDIVAGALTHMFMRAILG